MSILSEKNYLGDVLKLEIGEAALFSRDTVTLITGQNLAMGAVLGTIATGTATSAVKASGANTGAGTLTVDATTPVLANAKNGVYTVRVLAVGTFTVKDPNGVLIGDATYGSGATVTFADQIKFAFADDATTHFVAGDGFDVTVAVGSLKTTALAPAAVDGSQNATGVLALATDATSADVKTVVIARSAVLAANKVVWPGGITTPQKNAAIAQLAALGIVLRTGV